MYKLAIHPKVEIFKTKPKKKTYVNLMVVLEESHEIIKVMDSGVQKLLIPPNHYQKLCLIPASHFWMFTFL